MIEQAQSGHAEHDERRHGTRCRRHRAQAVDQVDQQEGRERQHESNVQNGHDNQRQRQGHDNIG